MGLFERIFGRKEGQPARVAQQTFQLLNGYTPSFYTWNGSIYESDLIRAALDAHGRHAAKLSINIQGSAKPNLRARLLVQPNPLQTWPQFLYRLATVLYAKNTAFIVPMRGEYGETNGVIGVVPQRWELVESKSGVPFVRFYFDNGKRAAVELDQVGIMTRYQMDSELFGENNEALKATLDLIAMQRQGITEGIKNGATYRFMATVANFSKDEDLAKERQRFDANNFRGESGGVLLWPNTYKDVKQLNQESYKVDADQLKLIKGNVYDYFGVNEDIIQNKSFGDSWLAFYEGSTEWFAIQLSEVMTRMLYTERERMSFGNRVWFSSNRLQYMSNADKMAAISQIADRGLMTRNELRDILNLAPLPEPYGSQIPARGEYYDITKPPEDKQPEENPAPEDGDEA